MLSDFERAVVDICFIEDDSCYCNLALFDPR
jgi:hypothetical protein